MKLTLGLLGLLLFFGAVSVSAQSTCAFNGMYRIDVPASDRLYTVVKDATGLVPFSQQQQFFMDLSTRLTPPDLLAFECRGRNVTIASSRSNRVKYVADGRTRREQTAGGTFVNSSVKMDRNVLTFLSEGRGEDNVNVTFQAIDGGRRLRVTRKIFAEQLPDPIVIRTFYDRMANGVDRANFDGTLVARGDRPAQQDRPSTGNPRPRRDERDADVEELRQALDEWIDATNRRDIPAQMRFYQPLMQRYYLARGNSLELVRAEKRRVFAAARSVDIRAAEPEIVFQEGGRVAVMRFRKDYRVTERNRTKSGSVIQELRWRLTPQGWKIFSERDVRVLR